MNPLFFRLLPFTLYLTLDVSQGVIIASGSVFTQTGWSASNPEGTRPRNNFEIHTGITSSSTGGTNNPGDSGGSGSANGTFSIDSNHATIHLSGNVSSTAFAGATTPSRGAGQSGAFYTFSFTLTEPSYYVVDATFNYNLMVGDSYGSNSAGADGINWFFDFGPYTAVPLGYSITNQNTLRTDTIHVLGTLMPPGQYTFAPTFSTSTESFLTGDSSSVGFSYDAVISFVAVPEPHLATLVTSAIAGLGCLRRRPNGVDKLNRASSRN